MDLAGPQILKNFLSEDELKHIPSETQEKLTTHINKFFDEYYAGKAAINRLDENEQKVEELQSQVQDYEVKLRNCNQNVDELRNQLDKVTQERLQLNESICSYEKDLATLRIAKNSLAESRDSLQTFIERQNSDLERLQQELRSYQMQLKTAVNAKCEALAYVEEIKSKEAALEFKENRIEQERTMLNNRIKTLNDELSRTSLELHNIQSKTTTQSFLLETRLNEKTEELKIVQDQCVQYKQTIDALTQNIQDLNSKILKQNEETSKMMEFYKKELEAKTKLADLCKSDSDDSNVEKNELRNAISNLRQMLIDASDQYGELETKFKATVVKLDQLKEDKDKVIESLKIQLKHANELMKQKADDDVDHAISKIAPSAAVASRLIRSDMSLTEIYSLYVNTSQDLEKQKRENSRLQLELNNIVQDLRVKAPIHEKRDEEHQKLSASYDLLIGEHEDLIRKKGEMEEVITSQENQINHNERENKKLKNAINDLSRQVCYLLKELEHLRMGITNNGPSIICGGLSTTDDVITKKLVTFNSITELHENNQKLLILVRDLSTKLEESENVRLEINESCYKEKIDNYTAKIQSMQETINQQANTISTLLEKTERYKKMYFKSQKEFEISAEENFSDLEDGNVDNSTPTKSTTSRKRSNNSNANQNTINSLESQIQDMKDQYKTLKEQYEYYIEEKKNNEKILNEQFDIMRTEARELTSSNCKLMSSLEYTKEQIKLQQKNIATYKQQIVSLEERNKNYENTIVKHEQTLQYLKDELLKTQKGYSSAETEMKLLRNENNSLKNTITRLQSEKEIFYRDQQNQNLLLNNIELIKTNLERSEIEGRARLEQRLDDTVRELSAQRRRFQEEEDRFREMINNYKRQADTAKMCMEEEKQQAEKLRTDIVALREEIAIKSNSIDDLSKKLQESLTPSSNDNPITVANKKVRELEIRCEEAKIEINSLQTELTNSRAHTEQLFKMSQNAEAEVTKLHEIHSVYCTKAEKEIAELKCSELDLKTKITELESEIQLSTIPENPTTSGTEQLTKSQNELKDALQKLAECNRTLRSLRSENTKLSESLNTAETKYANEMILHSVDIKEVTKLKSELNKVQDKLKENNAEQESVKTAYDELKKAYEDSIKSYQTEREEYENRLSIINNMNSNLHSQMEALTNKLSLVTQDSKTSISPNSSAIDISVLDNSQANIDEDNKTNEQLWQIIKFLRKEKDITLAKLDILKAENARLLSEQEILQKKVNDLTEFLNKERTKSEAIVVSATKHEEILRKIESFDALTDSNRVLREERNSLCARNKELNEKISSIEEELFPLQAQNREFTLKIEELVLENTSAKNEAMKWRHRANALVEKTNKNPEEFKRLQMERENLAKMLTNEKEILKQATDENNNLKTDNVRLETELTLLSKQLAALNEEHKKVSDELVTAKSTNSRIMLELMELKNKILQKEEIIQKHIETIELKEVQLQDVKNKEIQIRKIAKRYKDSYLELSNKRNASEENTGQNAMETSTNNTSEGTEGLSNLSSLSAEIDSLRSLIEKLNGELRQLDDEKQKLQKECDDLKNTLGEVKAQNSGLSEAKMALIQELLTIKTKFQASEDKLIQITNQYEETITRLEKEQVDQSISNKDLVARLTRDNESLTVRLNNLNRLLGPQQSAKASTSSIANSDKCSISDSSPRTANVKPLSGSTVQQSATVTPWRGSETPLASIRPISVQNSRTAAILPNSQQIAASGSTSSSTTGSASNTALVPPQQQVHTTASTSAESMSSSPTSSHTDYMPSTSSASVAVATIPPMGAINTAESSQEAESVQLSQQNDSQPQVSGGQSQVVALVSPRVEGSIQNSPSPNPQIHQDSNNQQPSTSGTTSSTSHIAVSSQNRHTPSSSNVTTTHAGSSGAHKRPRDLDGDASTCTEQSNADKPKQPKRLRTPMHESEANLLDVEYQVPTSSQRDQEDEIVVVDSEDDGMGEPDDGPMDGDTEHGYEDSYEPDADLGGNDGPEIKIDNNEVDVDECVESQAEYSSINDNQSTEASTSQAAAQQEKHQQSQTITSGSIESSSNIQQPPPTQWKQQASSTFNRQQKITNVASPQGTSTKVHEDNNKDVVVGRPSDNASEIVSSPQRSQFGYTESTAHSDEKDGKMNETETVNEGIAVEEEYISEEFAQKEEESKKLITDHDDEEEEVDDVYAEDVAGTSATSEHVDDTCLDHNIGGASQSELQDNQQNLSEIVSEENEGADGVTSEGEKQAVEDIEEEGREAEASSSPSINTRSKSTKGSSRRPQRGYQRGRPIPITWQDSPGHSRNISSNQRSHELTSNPMRGYPNQRNTRGRRIRRPVGNYNMRFP
ncbi:nucleoprotein TPR-like [Teleopsis dalmanni]|uniref:nucleoprotein TPR-like n=1 Tax=Teleopsis dalmanni TaxID=139649 RepID=UPI0018CD77C7|nr:nucleoprotein TPR-like [Teleopsis dalmanni]